MSVTNANGYILPINDLYASQKYGSKVHNIAESAAAFVACTAAANTVTATVAKLLNGYINASTPDAAGYALVTPTGTALSAAIPNITIGTSFSVLINNGSAQVLQLSAGVGVTVVGTDTIAASSASEAVFICTAANTWKAFLVSNA